jgi:predicted MarR family transcription regulator
LSISGRKLQKKERRKEGKMINTLFYKARLDVFLGENNHTNAFKYNMLKVFEKEGLIARTKKPYGQAFNLEFTEKGEKAKETLLEIRNVLLQR